MTPADREHADRLRGVARGGALNLAGAIVAAVVNILLILIVTQQVSPEQAGSLFAATSLFLIAATVARLGTTTGMVYWFARLRALGRSAELGRCLRIGLVPVGVVSVVVAVVMYAMAEPLGRLVGGDDPTTAIDFMRGLAAFLPLAALTDAVLAVTRGFGAMRPTVIVERVSRPLAQLALTAAVILVGSTDLLAVAWAFPYLGAAVVATLWLGNVWRRRVDALDQALLDAADGRPLGWWEFWRYTLPRSAGTLAQLALQRLDIVLVAALRGPAEAAIYTAATRFLVIGQLGNQALAFAVQPRLAAMMAVQDRAGANRLYQVGTGWLVLLTWPLYLTCLAFPTELLSVFGAGYSEGASVIVILCFAMLFATASGMVDEVLNMAGRTVWSLLNGLAALATMIVADLLLIPPLGLVGAAIGWAAAIVVRNLAPLVQLRIAYGFHPFGEGTKRAIVLCALTLGVLPPLLALIEAPLALRVVATIGGLGAFTMAVAHYRRVLAIDAFLAALRRLPDESISSETENVALVEDPRG